MEIAGVDTYVSILYQQCGQKNASSWQTSLTYYFSWTVLYLFSLLPPSLPSPSSPSRSLFLLHSFLHRSHSLPPPPSILSTPVPLPAVRCHWSVWYEYHLPLQASDTQRRHSFDWTCSHAPHDHPTFSGWVHCDRQLQFRLYRKGKKTYAFKLHNYNIQDSILCTVCYSDVHTHIAHCMTEVITANFLEFN